MKFDSLAALLLLQPAALHAWELPFKLPPKVQEIRSRLESSYDAYVPKFVKNIADPIAASPLLSLHRSLVEIPSVTGDERAVADFLAEYLASRNFTVEFQAVGDGNRSNIFAYLGANRSTAALLTSHIDTVPPFIPYKASSNTLSGRGTNDAKGSVAAQIIATEELLAEGAIKEGDVSLLYVVGEETHGDGMKVANALGVSWKAVIFGEPTENKLAVGHKGISLFEVIARGKACHSGYPHLGVNANSILIQALAILDGLQLPQSKLLGNTTVNVGRIDGGVAANVIPALASAEVAVRVAGDYDETLRIIKESVAHLPVELRFSDNGYGPVELSHQIKGFDTVVCNYGTDVPNLKGTHEKFLYGPGSILSAHGDDEYVLKSDLLEAVNGYKALIKEAISPSKRVPAVVAKEETAAPPTTEDPSPSSVSSEAVVVDKVVAETPEAQEPAETPEKEL